MNNNFIENYTLQKDNHNFLANVKYGSRKKISEEEIKKIPKRISENNFNKRYLTPLSSRYQVKSFDNNLENKSNYSHISFDINQDPSEKSKKEKDND